MQTIRGANTGLINPKTMQQEIVSAEQCLRHVWARARSGNTREALDFRSQVTFAVGHACEEVFASYHPNLEREKELTLVVGKDVEVVGHVDFIGGGQIHEVKSISSIDKALEYAYKGEPKESNIAQLVAYMVMAEVQEGFLHYIVTCYGKKTSDKVKYSIQPSMHSYKIEIENSGLINLNGLPLRWDATWVAAFWSQAAKMLTAPDKDLAKNAPRPNSDICLWCKYRDCCAFLEETGDVNQFKEAICAQVETSN